MMRMFFHAFPSVPRPGDTVRQFSQKQSRATGIVVRESVSRHRKFAPAAYCSQLFAEICAILFRAKEGCPAAATTKIHIYIYIETYLLRCCILSGFARLLSGRRASQMTLQLSISNSWSSEQ